MMDKKSMLRSYWVKARCITIYLMNSHLIVKVHKVTANKCSYIKKPNLPPLIMFDITAYVHILDEMQTK
mgnify:FL=1